MPYKRRYTKRRRFTRKPRSGVWGKYGIMGKSSLGLAKTALKTAKWVAAMVNTEYKFFNVDIGATAQTNNPATAVNLCTPAQGTAVQQRTGDSIKVKNAVLRGQWTQNGTLQETVRMILFIDKQNAITTGANMLTAAGGANAVFSPKNEDNKFDSKILLDKTFVVTTDNPIHKFDYTVKVDEHMHFNVASTTVDKNALKLLLFAQAGAAGTNFQLFSRVSYVDN